MPSSGPAAEGSPQLSKPRTREELQRELEELIALRPPQHSGLRSGELHSGSLTPTGPARTPTSAPGSGYAPNPTDHASLGSGAAGASIATNGSGAKPRAPPPANGSSHSMTGRSWPAGTAKGASDAGSRDRWRNLQQSSRGIVRVLRAHPSTWVTAILVALILGLAGVAGVIAAARAEERHRRDTAQGFASNAAVAFEVQLHQMLSPMMALATFVHDQPYYPSLAKRFDTIAKELLDALPNPGAVSSLQLTPQGVVHSFYPLKGNEAALGHNLLEDPGRRQMALETIARNQMKIQGPLVVKQGFMAIIPRMPIFIDNVTDPKERFGAPDEPYNCPANVCWNAAIGRMFWGFVSCVINLDPVAKGRDPRLRALKQQDYDYALYAIQPGSPLPAPFAQSLRLPSPPPGSVEAMVHLPSKDEWVLRISPRSGFVPVWRAPLAAASAVAAALVGLLVGAVLVGRRQQAWLLREMQATNIALEGEKERMDVLLARQYNLISCVLEVGGVGGGAITGKTAQEKTLARIEDMRRAIGVAPSMGTDELKLGDLLGVGSFGKVFRGVWRGSTVAVKTMVLPSNMSGIEKRERMIVLETAISSTLAHPNIVQTYTYTIRPITGNSVPPAVELVDSCIGSSGDEPGQLPPDLMADADHIHGFEVSLVLEFCDLGSLRDALDAGAFYTADNSLNYPAIVETAADIAKAMLHLHRHQVVHSDLKVRNVLLKSDALDPRGASAKVADFGLAVRMEHNNSHVTALQGTLPYMAPEAQMGRVSKGGDVFSFGITMWEIYTGGHAFAHIPSALLGHKVAVEGLRPKFPSFTPREYKALAEACWAHDPAARPSFEVILQTLTRMRQRIAGPTPPLGHFAKPRRSGEGASPGPSERPPALQAAAGGNAQQPNAAAPIGAAALELLKMTSISNAAPGMGDSHMSDSGTSLVGSSSWGGSAVDARRDAAARAAAGALAAAAAAQRAAGRRGYGSYMSQLEPIADVGDDEGRQSALGESDTATEGTGGGSNAAEAPPPRDIETALGPDAKG